jgi:hypothetical protein
VKIDDVVTGAQTHGDDVDFLTFEDVLSYHLTHIASIRTASPLGLIPSVGPRVARAQDGRHLGLALRMTDLLRGNLLCGNEKDENDGSREE